MLRAILFSLVLLAPLVRADGLVTIDTRPGIRVAYWWMERPDAKATLVLLPGGEGGLGVRDGVPHSQNFLVRSRDYFAAAGFNVALVGKPSDQNDMTAAFRATADHVADVRAIVARLGKQTGKPVWLVGTSLGSISVAATAIGMDPAQLAGIVMSSSVTGTNGNVAISVPQLKLSEIRVPVLVMHHQKDDCAVCDPYKAHTITDALDHAPVKKLLLVTGGGGASGKTCEALHYHGYIGMEKDAAGYITDWISNPRP